MNNLINAENTGTPLTIIEKSAYQEWLEEQDQSCQTWLANTQFSGSGLTLIPATDGQLSQALFVVQKADDFFACGDLITLLPQGQFLLNSKPQHIEPISFGWLVGAYKFDRYVTKKSEKKIGYLSD